MLPANAKRTILRWMKASNFIFGTSSENCSKFPISLVIVARHCPSFSMKTFSIKESKVDKDYARWCQKWKKISVRVSEIFLNDQTYWYLWHKEGKGHKI